MSTRRRYKSPPIEETVWEFRFLPNVETRASLKYDSRTQFASRLNTELQKSNVFPTSRNPCKQ